MNFLKALFGVKEENTEDKKKNEEQKNFDILKYDGVKAMHSNQHDYAVKCFSHALQIQEDPEIRDYLSRIFIYTGNMEQAKTQLQKLSEKQPDNIKIRIRMANVAYLDEDYDAMSEICEKASQIDNGNTEIMYLHAKACIGNGNNEKAVELLTRALDINKEYGEAYLLRGETLLENGNIEDAGKDAAWLLEHTLENEDVLMLKANIEKAAGHFSDAIFYYSKVIENNPFNINAYKLRGELRINTGDESSGKADLEQAEELGAQQPGNEKDNGIENKVKDAYKSMDPYGVF